MEQLSFMTMLENAPDPAQLPLPMSALDTCAFCGTQLLEKTFNVYGHDFCGENCARGFRHRQEENAG
jgi:hypothetical protein